MTRLMLMIMMLLSVAAMVLGCAETTLPLFWQLVSLFIGGLGMGVFIATLTMPASEEDNDAK